MIDILSQSSDQAAFFTVNNALPYVSLQKPLFPNSGRLETAEGLCFFTRLDNYTLLSLGIVLPLSFELYDTIINPLIPPVIGLPEIAMYYSTPFNPPVAYQRIQIPFLNYEMNYGKTYMIPDVFAFDFFIHGIISPVHDLRISMLNIPAALNTLKFYCPVFVKIQHTIELKLPPPPPHP